MKANLDFVGSVVTLVSCFFTKSLFLEINIWTYVLSLEWDTTFSFNFFLRCLLEEVDAKVNFKGTPGFSVGRMNGEQELSLGFMRDKWAKWKTDTKILSNETGKAFLYHPQK